MCSDFIQKIQGLQENCFNATGVFVDFITALKQYTTEQNDNERKSTERTKEPTE